MQWKIGNVTVSRIVELEAPTSPRFLFGRSKQDVLGIKWLRPHFVTETGLMILSIHALVVESEGRKIIVDTCLGNDKERKIPGWSMLKGSFLEDLAEAGFPRESFDTVMCTHLHVDHVGWNTMLVDGKWAPTFPNARYLFARQEWEYWSQNEQDEFGPVVEDSVRPIVDAGLAELVDMDHRITSEVWLEPTPGHTPGHVSVRISSQGEEAVITGDMTHHPCQFAHPDWAATVDYDADQSTQTRLDFYARYAEQPVLVIGTHFATPTAGKIVRDGDAYRLDVD
ncbi:MAG: MBL fold metallo-hydrolase [Rhodospirillaceae bacterium]|nr:MBL fold metallo-hydrolase [Rhodospirillaceae bacterium]MBT5047234.1 MBL fold metallo-hydrolase [Rhodospirillaceae bacterium]MBT5896070.1 MBL fold metallo-hydrolase [Rhodospirillaceae bacterium]MBT6427313.1 MBL fold metallo-hydrolase [Rhodospirillaceae bacterium]